MPEIMPWHKTQLLDPEYTRVDLVKEGANSRAHIKLFKSKGGETEMKLEDILKLLKPEHSAVVQKALDDAQEEVRLAKEAVNKAKEAEEPAAGATEEEILKSVKDPAVKALLETQIAKAKAAEAEVQKAREEQLSNEAIAKAKEVPNIGAEETQLVDVYKKLKGVDAQLAEDVFGIFKAASALVNEGGVLSEVGKSAGTTDNAVDENAAWDKIEKAADAIAETAKISKSAAISRVIKEQPELYSAYLKAQQG